MHETHGGGHHYLTMVVVEMVTDWLSKKQVKTRGKKKVLERKTRWKMS